MLTHRFAGGAVTAAACLTLPFALLLARPAQAQTQAFVTLDMSNPSVSSPSATENIAFSGTLTNDSGTAVSISDADITGANDAAGDHIVPTFTQDFINDIITNRLYQPGTTTPITFFTAEIDADQPVGLYNQFAGPTLPPYLVLYFSDSTSSTVNFSVDVTPSTAPAPEMGTIASFGGMLAVSIGALLVTARKRRASRSS